jgi:hypothetical protein
MSVFEAKDKEKDNGSNTHNQKYPLQKAASLQKAAL